MDYEKKYNEALERARVYHNNAKDAGLYSTVARYENIFPELRKSEDENLKNKSGYYKAGKFWKASTLWNAVKDKTPQRVSNLYILQDCTWNIGSLREFAENMKNVQEVNLNYPIILDINGNILDGAHRVVKAYLEDKDIDVVYLGDDEWPEPDYDEAKAVKESEDEKIRKRMVEYFNGRADNYYFLGFSKCELLAWLEKQKEEEGYEAIPVESTLEYKLGFKAGKESEKQKEYLADSNKTSASEDERIRKALLEFLEDVWHRGKNANFDRWGKADCAGWIAYLEKQKEYPTNEEMLRTLRVEYEKGVADTIAKYEQKEQKTSNIDKLKSISTPADENWLEIQKQWEKDDELSDKIKAEFEGFRNLLKKKGIDYQPTQVYWDDFAKLFVSSAKKYGLQKPVEYLPKQKVFDIMTKLTNFSYSQLIPINSDEYKKIHEITSDVRSLLDYPIESKPVECVADSVKFDEGFKTGREIGFREGIESVKPVEWSEEDEQNYQSIRAILLEDTAKKIGKRTYGDVLEWYESKGKGRRNLPKIKWSKDDEDMLLSTIEYVQTYPGHRQSVVNWLKNRFKLLYPQPNMEWSDEDEKNLALVVDCIYKFYPDPIMKYRLKNWLKSLRPQPKQEWSNNDIEARNEIMIILSNSGKTALASWFSNAFPTRPHWKLSEKKYDGNMDKECINLCDILNSIPSIDTFESCCGHLKDKYSIWFFCNDIITISQLGKCVERNYSDGKWELLVDSTDTHPTGVFWLRSKIPFQSYDEMNKSIKGLCDSIRHWFNTKFDSYFNGNSGK